MRLLWYASLFSTRLLLFPDFSLSKISGGTGFAPFHQLLFRRLLQGKVAPSTRITLLHASRSPAELPPLSLLQPLIDRAVTHPEHFQLKLLVDGASKTPAPEGVAKHLKVGRLNKSSIARSLGIPDGACSWSSWISNLWTRGQPKAGDIDIRKKNVLVLVCGPEPYVLLISSQACHTC
jgi:cytochrome-b5 reductase